MAWFKRNRDKNKLMVKTVRRVLEVLSQEETYLEMDVHFIEREKAGAYAKKLDKLLGVKGTSESGGSSEWIQWVKGKLRVTIFIKWE